MTGPAASPGKLGWTPGPDDPRTLYLADYTTPDLPPPPKTLDWLRASTSWPLLGNDQIGNCVVVSCAHHVQDWTSNAAGAPVLIPYDDVVRAYSAVSGYDPATGANDDGCKSLDVLNFWRHNGVGGRRILAYVRLDHRDTDQVKTAANLFGGLLIAAQMPRSAATQFRNGRVWTVTTGPAGTRGSWGGHAMHCGAYSPRGFTVVTWGRTQRMTLGWWRKYVAEAYAIVSTDFLDRDGGRSPLGFDLAAMLGDLRRVTT